MILSCELTLLGQRVSGRAGVNTLEVPVTGTVMGRGASVARSLTHGFGERGSVIPCYTRWEPKACARVAIRLDRTGDEWSIALFKGGRVLGSGVGPSHNWKKIPVAP